MVPALVPSAQVCAVSTARYITSCRQHIRRQRSRTLYYHIHAVDHAENHGFRSRLPIQHPLLSILATYAVVEQCTSPSKCRACR